MAKFDLKDKLLSVEFEQNDTNLYRVSLYLQGDDTSETIFQNSSSFRKRIAYGKYRLCPSDICQNVV